MRFTTLSLRPRVLRLACLLIASLGVGCSSDDTPDDTPTPASTGIDVKRYDLKGEYDWTRSRLVATVGITLAPTAEGVEAIGLDSAVTEVKAVRLASGGALPFSADAEQGQLRIDVSGVPGLAKGADITLEIDYEAAPSDSLIPVADRKGDPLTVRTVYTMSEPRGAASWMPCHDTPSDRALFSIDMGMDDAETMIANGDRVADNAGEGSGHRMKYETAYTLPTYLMAFAISDFEVESTTKGDLPVSIWHRRGLTGSFDAVLEETVGMITRFEALLGPYPFEKYAVVHLPALSAGGIENASITFQYEGSGAEAFSGDLYLTAHELAHQWFGDLVTVESWDDLWIKEGMATLLEAEGLRVHTDLTGPLGLHGDNLYAVEGEAIRDTALEPEDKYTSGPYGRAGWLLTQIRSLVGEETFWQTVRGVLDTHRFGTIGTDEFIAAFAPALGPDVTARVKRAVDAKGIPALEIEALPTGGASVTLQDPDGALVAPMDLSWVAEDGSVRNETLEVGEPLDLAPEQDGEFLILDPLDRHPGPYSFLPDDASSEAFSTSVLPLLLPTSPEGAARLLESGAAHQESALWSSWLEVTPEGFNDFVEALDSEVARVLAVSTACTVAGDPGLDPQTTAAWTSVLEGVLPVEPPPFAVDLLQSGGYAACTMFDPATAFASEWTQMETGLPTGGISDARLAFLSAFKLPAPMALSIWGSVATQSNSARARWIATQNLRSYLNDLAPADLPAWRAFFVEMLSATELTDLLREAIRAVVTAMAPTAAENADALAGLGVVLHSSWTGPVHARAVCAAFTLTQGDAAAWNAFTGGLEGAPLTEGAAARIEDPSLCQ